MKRLFKHIILCLMVCLGMMLFSCSPSANDHDGLGNNKNYSQSKGTPNLENDSLSVKYIKAFEQRAIQKLQDLKDYFEILSDSKIDSTFKNQAKVMASELFASEYNTITFSLDENQENPSLKVDTFFTTIQNKTYGKLSLEIHNISVINKIRKLNDSEYEGAIKFSLFVLTKQKTLKMDLQSEIIVKKVEKKFGAESKQVWEVFLGDIFQIP
jgi:hypothetical protein